MYHLPADASSESRLRHDLAQRLLKDCPPQLGREIILTGSVARGVADQFSDLELRFYVDEIQSAAVYEHWLDSAGATVDPATTHWGAALTTKSHYQGILIRAAWYPLESLEWTLTPLLTAQTSDHWQLVEAWHLNYAVALNTTPTLAFYKNLLAHYPLALQKNLISNAIESWAEPHGYPSSLLTVWVLAQRGAKFALAARLEREMERLLRLVFALNRCWEPDYKWLEPEVKRLQTVPSRLLERLDEVVCLQDAPRSVKVWMQLILDTLELVPAPFQVEEAKARAREALNLAVFMK